MTFTKPENKNNIHMSVTR